jgi:hypothetical protein
MILVTKGLATWKDIPKRNQSKIKKMQNRNPKDISSFSYDISPSQMPKNEPPHKFFFHMCFVLTYFLIEKKVWLLSFLCFHIAHD